jgi:hypothetical protein
MNEHNKNTIQWGVLRENLDKLERDCKEKGIPLMHTWRYQHSPFPKTIVHKVQAETIKVPTGYKFCFDVTRDNLDFTLEIMAKLPKSYRDALVVNPCSRQSWGSFSHDKMVGFDITIHAKNLDEAVQVANYYWHEFKGITPLMGHVDQLNLDDAKNILLEVTGSQALRDLMEEDHISWVLMVAPRIASVAFSMDPQNLEDLDKVIAIITQHNLKYKGIKVRDGGWVVDRIILSKLWLTQEDVRTRTGGSRVLWDRFWGNKRDYLDNSGSANFMSNRDISSDSEALATLSGFQYQESQKTFYLEMLKGDISKHLINRLPQDVKNQDPNPTFTWSTTGTNTVFKVKCSSNALARWLCVSLVDLTVMQSGNSASIGFKSTKNVPMKSDWSHHFSQMMIKDASSEFKPEVDKSPTSSSTPWEEVPTGLPTVAE